MVSGRYALPARAGSRRRQRRKGQSYVIPKPRGLSQKLFDEFPPGLVRGLVLFYGLIFEPHGLVNRCKLAVGKNGRPFANRFSQRLFRNKRIDDATAESFGGAFERARGDAVCC